MKPLDAEILRLFNEPRSAQAVARALNIGVGKVTHALARLRAAGEPARATRMPTQQELNRGEWA